MFTPRYGSLASDPATPNAPCEKAGRPDFHRLQTQSRQYAKSPAL